jgi:hypothetical protein
MDVTSPPNNTDATFKNSTGEPKPSEPLLHYNCGAAAVKNRGYGKEVLQNYTKPPRPPAPVATSVGPSRTAHDRSIAVRKRDAARATSGVRTGAEELKGSGK